MSSDKYICLKCLRQRWTNVDKSQQMLTAICDDKCQQMPTNADKESKHIKFVCLTGQKEIFKFKLPLLSTSG